MDESTQEAKGASKNYCTKNSEQPTTQPPSPHPATTQPTTTVMYLSSPANMYTNYPPDLTSSRKDGYFELLPSFTWPQQPQRTQIFHNALDPQENDTDEEYGGEDSAEESGCISSDEEEEEEGAKRKKREGEGEKRVTLFQRRLLKILPERVLRALFVIFGVLLCIILMIDGASYSAFSALAGNSEEFYYCPLTSHATLQIRGQTSDEASSLGRLAGLLGLIVGILFCIIFVFTLFVDALNAGKVQLCMALSMQICCVCVTAVFLLSWAFLWRDITSLEMYIESNYRNYNVHNNNMGRDEDSEEDNMDDDDEREFGEDHHTKRHCGPPPVWGATSLLGVLGGAGWFGMSLWILIWLITTRTAAAIRKRSHESREVTGAPPA